MTVRKIVHIEDAFYASVQQRDNPQLRGKPVAVTCRGNRSVVRAATLERPFPVVIIPVDDRLANAQVKQGDHRPVNARFSALRKTGRAVQATLPVWISEREIM